VRRDVCLGQSVVVALELHFANRPGAPVLDGFGRAGSGETVSCQGPSSGVLRECWTAAFSRMTMVREHERGCSRLHRREWNLAGRKVRPTRTSWIVSSRFLAAEAARNGNEKGRLFGTASLRAGSRTEVVPSECFAGEGARHATPPRHTRFAPQSILRGCRRVGWRYALVTALASVVSYAVTMLRGSSPILTVRPTEKPESGFGI